MKVAIFGAHGRVGKLIVQKIRQSYADKITPLAILRSEQQKEEPLYKGLNTSITSLTEGVGKLTEILKGQDAVVLSAGAGGKGLDKTFAVDLDGAVKVMEASKNAGVQRFIMVSAIAAEERDFWYDRIPALRSYYIAKKYADRELRSTDLNYTILQPGNLADDGETGKLAYNFTGSELSRLEFPVMKIFRADVAQFAIDILQDPRSYRQTLTLLNGHRSFDEYLSDI